MGKYSSRLAAICLASLVVFCLAREAIGAASGEDFVRLQNGDVVTMSQIEDVSGLLTASFGRVGERSFAAKMVRNAAKLGKLPENDGLGSQLKYRFGYFLLNHHLFLSRDKKLASNTRKIILNSITENGTMVDPIAKNECEKLF